VKKARENRRETEAEVSWGKVPEIQVCEGGIPELFKGMRV